ncbi:hypothetical protein, partial [Haloferula sp.]|uniref:hypothetical protein n=1 Tax=Haloferula sp. TaxID=2497595 RepID=UPI003C70A8A9
PTQEEQDTPGRAAKRSLGMIPKPIQTPPRDTTAELKSDRLLGRFRFRSLFSGDQIKYLYLNEASLAMLENFHDI